MRHHSRWMMLLAALGLLVAACGGGAAPDPATETTEAETTETTEAETTETTEAETTETTEAMEEIDPETYYEGKTIRFITSSGPGGGTDTKIRTLATQLTRFIPGEPAARVSNVEPHVAGMNFVWNSEPDGLTIMLTAAPTLEFEFFEEAEWDSSEWTYIGSMDAACGNVLLARGDLGYETITDAAGAESPQLITMTAAPNPADVEPIALGTMLIADYLDLPLVVKRVAESGQGALNLAMERGEINFARYGASWCLLDDTNPGWLEDGFVVPLLDVNESGPATEMPEVVEEHGRPPHVSEVLTEEQYEEWRGLVAASRAGGNPIFMPPGTPDEIANIVRDAFNEAAQDEDFVEVMETSFGNTTVQFLPAEEIGQIITENEAALTEYADDFAAITEELFAKYVQ